jgi:hypothetical protein
MTFPDNENPTSRFSWNSLLLLSSDMTRYFEVEN